VNGLGGPKYGMLAGGAAEDDDEVAPGKAATAGCVSGLGGALAAGRRGSMP
jgi:hypothetical protein